MENNSEWNLIESFYCLNLDRNKQRWIDTQAQLLSVGINNCERIECIESKENRYISFNQSHYDTVKKGYDTKRPFAIFEDDIIFDHYWKHIAEASRELPEKWDALYLGANIMGDWVMPARISAHLCRLHNSWMTHAIVYSQKGAKYVLDNFRRDEISAENPAYDEWLRVRLMPLGNVYLLTPMIVYQKPGYSDVWQTDVDYRPVHIDGNKLLAKI